MEPQDYLQYALAFLTLLASGIAVVKYLMDRDDKSETTIRAEFNRILDDVRKEISDIKDTHVKQDAHNRHAQSVERQIHDVSTMVSNMSNSINIRLDGLYALMTQSNKK